MVKSIPRFSKPAEPMKMNSKIKKRLLHSAGLCCILTINSQGSEAKKPNVLFIAVDDLRPSLGCYGDINAITPNIDKLAKRGVVFNRAYCQQAVCNPSRASVMTGLRPDQIGVTNLESHFRDRLPDVETLPQAFMRNGYQTIGIGKIFHGQRNTQDDLSWTKPPVMNLSKKEDEYALPKNKEGGKADSYEWAAVEDEAYEDGRIAKEAIRELKELKKTGNPFFLAVGFKKPHLPFCIPQKYWDLYQDELFAGIPHPERPSDAPDVAFHNSQELRGYRDITEKGKIEPTKVRMLWHGYYACVSYVDAQVGKIIDLLDELGLTENTIIVLWGDHGYHLGEQSLWCKSTNFELDTRIPLVISAPGMSKSGVNSNSLVEAVDLYPTLLDLCGLKPEGDLAGVSLKPVLTNPETELKQAVFSQFVRPYSALFSETAGYMGYSVRTKEWRCTAWFNLQNDSIEYRELYDLRKTAVERKNCSGEKELKEVESRLICLLRDYRSGNYQTQPAKEVTSKIFTIRNEIPVLTMKSETPVLLIKLSLKSVSGCKIRSIKLDLEGTTDVNDIERIRLSYAGSDSTFAAERQFGETKQGAQPMLFCDNLVIADQTAWFRVFIRLKDKIDLLHKINVNCESIETNEGILENAEKKKQMGLRVGIALRKHGDDNVHTYRIPGLTTSASGTLLAVYDVRRESSRDLQGNIDIGLSRSIDGGNTWEPMRIILDQRDWGGLPEKFNGVSDPCILLDKKSNTIFVAGLWMYGVLDANGRWTEGLSKTSEAWNHQWRDRGSQPGFDVKQTAQFLMTKSTDDGQTWSDPVNLTRMCKKEKWWLWAPAPGHGITLDDGTLVFPTQGRDEKGRSFSNITWSGDGGQTWKTTNIASYGTTENMIAQLTDGSVMINARDGRSRGNTSDTNGRVIFVTDNLGETWKEHPTSRKALIEPTCMASLHKHEYTENDQKKSILVFSNPSSKTSRDHMTIKVSFDDGKTWPEKYWILLDEKKGRGYSCLTSVDEQTIGILYEGSQADLIFQKIALSELIGK